MDARLGFPPEEFAHRLAKAQSAMVHADLDGIFLTTEPEIRYFTGFRTPFWQSPTRPWFLFLPVQGAPVAVIPEIGAELMRSTWVTDIRTWPAPAPDDDGISLLVEERSPLARSRGRIGLLMGHETHLRMPLADFDVLKDNLPGLRWADCTAMVQSLRMVKSEAEIAKLSHICALAGRAFDRVPQIAHAGQPLCDLFRDFRIALLREGAEDVPYLVGGAGPGGYGDVISPPSARALQTGDVVMMDTGASRDGYFCDFDRNWAIGTASDAARRAYDTLWQATQVGLAAARPGITCRDLMQAMAQHLPEGGDIGRLGHGLGMQLTETPSLARFDDTELQEGMVLTLEPSLAYAGKMMVHEENIVIRASGAELLTPRAAPELPVIS
jgi:Xaa-Pro aminopeptidase